MLACPYCSDEVRPDPKNPGKYLCYNCKKRFQADQLVDVPDNDGGYPYDEEDDMGYQGMPAQAPYSPYPQGPADQGMPAYPQGDIQQPQKLPKGKAIASIIFGILSMLTCVIMPISVIFGVFALVLGIISVRKVKKGLGSGKGLGIGGIITGILGIILGAVIGGLMLITVLYVGQEAANGNIVVNENTNTIEFKGDAANMVNESNMNLNDGNYNVIVNGNSANTSNGANANAAQGGNANAGNANAGNANSTNQQPPASAPAQTASVDRGAIAGSLYDNGAFAVSFDGRDRYLVEPDPRGYHVMTARDPNGPSQLYIDVDGVAAASEEAYAQTRQSLGNGSIQSVQLGGRDVPAALYQDQDGFHLAFCKILNGNQLSVDIVAPNEADARAMLAFFTRF